MKKLRTTERGASKETRILDAAQRLFSLHGHSRVTMDDIAADLGMVKAGLYYYFPSKDAVFLRVIDREQRAFFARVDAIISGRGDAARALRRYAELRNTLFRDLLALDVPSVQPWYDDTRIYRDAFRPFSAGEHRRVTDIIRAGNAAGGLRVRRPAEAARLFLGLLRGLRLGVLRSAVVDAERTAAFRDLERDTRALVAIFIRGIAAQPGPVS